MDREDRLAKILWDYLKLDQPPRKSEVIIAMGCRDHYVPEYAAQLYRDGWAPLVVASGGFGTRSEFQEEQPEAEVFAEILLKNGVPKDKLFQETRSSNTGENVTFSRALLTSMGLSITTVIAVHKPYMERRVYATFKKQWREVEVIPRSKPVEYEQYDHPKRTKSQFIDALVGSTKRVWTYPAKGFQIPQTVPEEIRSAYEELVKMGYGE